MCIIILLPSIYNGSSAVYRCWNAIWLNCSLILLLFKLHQVWVHEWCSFEYALRYHERGGNIYAMRFYLIWIIKFFYRRDVCLARLSLSHFFFAISRNVSFYTQFLHFVIEFIPLILLMFPATNPCFFITGSLFRLSLTHLSCFCSFSAYFLP